MAENLPVYGAGVSEPTHTPGRLWRAAAPEDAPRRGPAPSPTSRWADPQGSQARGHARGRTGSPANRSARPRSCRPMAGRAGAGRLRAGARAGGPLRGGVVSGGRGAGQAKGRQGQGSRGRSVSRGGGSGAAPGWVCGTRGAVRGGAGREGPRRAVRMGRRLPREERAPGVGAGWRGRTPEFVGPRGNGRTAAGPAGAGTRGPGCADPLRARSRPAGAGEGLAASWCPAEPRPPPGRPSRAESSFCAARKQHGTPSWEGPVQAAAYLAVDGFGACLCSLLAPGAFVGAVVSYFKWGGCAPTVPV